MTVQHAPVHEPFGDEVAIYMILRGCENIPIVVADMTLPRTARLALHKIENKRYQPLEWVPIVDLAEGTGLVYQTALAVESGNLNFLEGCYHLYSPHNQPFPGTVLSTGTEDFFDSANYFDGGKFHFPVSGDTHQETNASDKTVRWYAIATRYGRCHNNSAFKQPIHPRSVHNIIL